MNHPKKHTLLSNLVREHRPDIYLIQEIKMLQSKVVDLKLVVYKDVGMHFFDSDGASRGLAISWNPHLVKAKIIFSSTNHISMEFVHLNDGSSWVILNVYVPINHKVVRRNFSENISSLRSNFTANRWIVMGDFKPPSTLR